LYKAGKLKSNIGKRYGLGDTPRAHADLEAGATTGASLLVP
jgi:NADPH2:quinone reductase